MNLALYDVMLLARVNTMPQGEEYICTYDTVIIVIHTLNKLLALLVPTLAFELKSSAPQISAKLRNLSQRAVEMVIQKKSTDECN